MGNDNRKTRLELTWIWKEDRPKLESSIQLEDREKSYNAPHRLTAHDLCDNRSLQDAREVEHPVNEIEGKLEQKVSSQRLFFSSKAGTVRTLGEHGKRRTHREGRSTFSTTVL